MSATIPLQILLRLTVLAIGMFAVGCKGSPPEKLTGSGSTFVWPMMIRWVSEFEREKGIKVAYRNNGSSKGIDELLAGQVDFAFSDGPLGEEQITKLNERGEEVIHIPVVLSAVVAIYNLDEIHDTIRFTGPILADIYLGKIKKWNDKAIQDLNPRLKLPEKEIKVIHRSDGSGTTYIWTDYLSKVSPAWKQKIGTGRSVTWPIGTGAEGNGGVAERVKQTPGSIGYVDLADAHRKSLPFGLVQNREMGFVQANLESVIRAAENNLKQIPADLRFSLTDPPGKGSYPISGTTWAIVHLNQTKNNKGRQLVTFLKWLTSDGQLFAEQLLYAKLPTELADKANLAVERITVQ